MKNNGKKKVTRKSGQDQPSGLNYELTFESLDAATVALANAPTHDYLRLDSRNPRRVVVELRSFLRREMIGWVLSQGRDVELIGPGEARAELSLIVGELYAMYDPPAMTRKF